MCTTSVCLFSDAFTPTAFAFKTRGAVMVIQQLLLAQGLVETGGVLVRWWLLIVEILLMPRSIADSVCTLSVDFSLDSFFYDVTFFKKEKSLL